MTIKPGSRVGISWSRSTDLTEPIEPSFPMAGARNSFRFDPEHPQRPSLRRTAAQHKAFSKARGGLGSVVMVPVVRLAI
jgi:hypothetical protein